MPSLLEKQREEKKTILSTKIFIWGEGLNILMTEVIAVIQHILCTQTIKEDIVASS